MEILADSGTTDNFIDKGLVSRVKFEPKDFEGFKVVMTDWFDTPCRERIQQLSIVLGFHQIKEDFYITKTRYAKVVLFIQRLHC